jgi:purine-binding chemotaxis protein CheW
MAVTQSSAGTQVLEFRLGSDRYCVDISYVAEIVDVHGVTPVPNAPRHVRGVMDLRGRTTTIIDPTVRLNLDATSEADRIIVFDPEHADGESVGWVVDEVDEVSSVPPDAVDEAPVQHEQSARGIVRRDDGLVIWLRPETATADRVA